MGARASLQELFNTAMIQSGEPIYGNLPAGQLSAGGAISAASPNITMAQAIPSWVVAGMNVYDVTTSQNIGTVSSGAGTTTLVLGANAAHAGSGNADVLQFGFTPADLAAGFTAGVDVRGLVSTAVQAINDALAVLNYLSTDVITSSEDSAANTVIGNAITSLS